MEGLGTRMVLPTRMVIYRDEMRISWDMMGFTLWSHQTWLDGNLPIYHGICSIKRPFTDEFQLPRLITKG